MFFKKADKKEENNFIVKVCALLIHAAKIDENYTDKEEEIIKKTLIRRRIAISVNANLKIVLNIFSGILPNIDLPKFVPM